MEKKVRRKGKSFFLPLMIFTLFAIAAFLLPACSFDYDSVSAPEQTKPDIIMDDIEYVRVRGGDPLVRFQAEHAERWEKKQTMDLRNFSFEQMENSGETVNAEGRAGSATVELGTGDVAMSGGIRISVDSEDITISTGALQWRDREKTLTAAPDDEVDVQRSDGTSFSGRGFSADARNRTWVFSGEVKGTYVESEDGEDEATEQALPLSTEGR
jgi:LPS export ABC transporter protein LptC